MPRRSHRWPTLLLVISLVFACHYFFDISLLPSSRDLVVEREQAPKPNLEFGKFTRYGGGRLAEEDETLDLRKVRKALVVASLEKDDTSWVAENFPDWERNIYIVDKHMAGKLTVRRNKGREANVYLTYMIDHYDDLPDFVLFMHSLRYQWHNEDPMYDGVPMIQNLRLRHVKAAGFVNIRCTWVLGCPVELKNLHLGDDKPTRDDRKDLPQEEVYPTAFKQLFPEKAVPQTIGAHCGAQFAVSKAAIQSRPRKDYVRFRKWLLKTRLPDSISGRVFEYSWHVMFGKEATHCPPAEDCFCLTYGLCNLTCPDSGSCDKRYILPQYAAIPPGWPNSGLEGTKGWPAKDWYL